MKALRIVAGLGIVVATATACGGSSSGGAGGATVKSDNRLVVLNDDKHLQQSDNIVAVVRTKIATSALTDNLSKVDTTLTQDALVQMNKRATVDHDDPATIASDYVSKKGLDSGLSKGSGNIRVGAANFAENQILANLYAKVLDGAGFSTSVKDVQSREVYEPALEHGQLDVMPEYAATLTEFLNTKDNGANAKPIASTDISNTIDALKKIGAKHGLEPVEPSTATDQNAFAVRKDFAAKWGLTNLSDLTKVKGTLVLGGPPECPTRPYCKPGLEKLYGVHFTGFKSLDAGGPLTRAAIQQGKVQIGLVFSSDPALASG